MICIFFVHFHCEATFGNLSPAGAMGKPRQRGFIAVAKMMDRFGAMIV